MFEGDLQYSWFPGFWDLRAVCSGGVLIIMLESRRCSFWLRLWGSRHKRITLHTLMQASIWKGIHGDNFWWTRNHDFFQQGRRSGAEW